MSLVLYALLRISLWIVLGILAVLGLLAQFAPHDAPLAAPREAALRPSKIGSLQVTGVPFKLFDHASDQQEPDNFADAQITAWRELDGTVNLMIPNAEAYRMRGPDLGHLRIDPRKIFSSRTSAHEIAEDRHNYAHWFMGPYSTDGRHFYTLSHSEWYACLLAGDCERPAANGEPAEANSWTGTVNSFRSSDGGATWRLNVVQSRHVVADTAYRWSGSPPLARRIYLRSLNHSGIFQPSRVIKEGDFFYSVGYYLHRDFSRIGTTGGPSEAPVDRAGYVLMRTADITDPSDWQAWVGANRFEPIVRGSFNTFLPQSRGKPLDAAPPQIIYDVNAQCYILINTLFGGSNAVYFSTTRSLANPSWSDAHPIAGTEDLASRIAGAARTGGLNDANYPSVVDPDSEGFNFEFTHGHPLLLFVVSLKSGGRNVPGRDVYAVPLSVTYR